jgi:uncharacterized Zn-binding protein involved in type VI secretion
MLPVACMGDIHICPLHGPNTVAAGGSAVLNGRPIARMGDPCACGCLILDGSPMVTLDNRPVALLGSKTTLGGVVMPIPSTAFIK